MLNQAPPDMDIKDAYGICDACTGDTRALTWYSYQLGAFSFVRNGANDLVLTTPATLTFFSHGGSDDADGDPGYDFAHNPYTTNALRNGYLSNNQAFWVEGMALGVEGLITPNAGVPATGIITELNGTLRPYFPAYAQRLVQALVQAYDWEMELNTGDECEWLLGPTKLRPGGIGLPGGMMPDNGWQVQQNAAYLRRAVKVPPANASAGRPNLIVTATRRNNITVTRDPMLAAPDADCSLLMWVILFGDKYGKVISKQNGDDDDYEDERPRKNRNKG